MKKYILILLIVCMLIPNIFSVEAVQSENEKMDERAQLLIDLGILEAYEGSSRVTKGMLCNALAQITSNPSEGARYFANTDKDEPLEYVEAAMVLLSMTGYNYRLNMEGKEINTVNAMILASQLNLIPNGAKANDIVNIKDFSQMMYRGITIDILKQTSFGETVQYETQKDCNILSEVMNIIWFEGTVNAVGNISDYKKISKKNIKIGNEIYVYDKIPYDDYYMGLYVKAFMKENTKNELVAIMVLSKKNNIINITNEDLSDSPNFTNENIVYYEGEREKSAKLSKEVDVIYNLEFLKSFTREDLLIDNGSLKLIDNNGDDIYEVVIVDSYESFVLESFSEKSNTMYARGGGTIELEDFIKDRYDFLDQNGNKILMSKLSKYNVISIRKTATGKITKMVQSIDKANGIVTKFDDDEITVGGKDYKYTKKYKYALDKEKISLGDEVVLYLDFVGKIVDINIYKAGAVLGYLINFIDPSSSGISDMQVKILSEDGKIKHFNVESSITLNGVRKSAEEAFKKSCNNPLWTEKGEKNGQLITYKVSPDEKLIWLETARDKHKIGGKGYDDGLTLNFDTDKYGKVRPVATSIGKWLASKYYVTTDTKLFVIPPVGKEDEDDLYKLVAGTAFPSSDEYSFKLYNVNKSYVPQAAVYRQPGSSTWVEYYTPTYVVNKVNSVMNINGEESYQLQVYDKGVLKNFTVSKSDIKSKSNNSASKDSRLGGINIGELKKGSVIQIHRDYNQEIDCYSLQLTPIMDNSEKIFEMVVGGGWDVGISKNTYYGEPLLSYGEVLEKTEMGVVFNNHIPVVADDEGEFPVIEWNRHLNLKDEQRIIIYNKNEDKIEVAQAIDINVEDYLFVHMSGTSILNLIVYR